MQRVLPSLIFLWRKPPTTLAVLGSFLVLSTLIHAMGFYVFHVVYQPAVSLPPSPAHLTVIDPASPKSAPFLAWLESEDPALTFVPDPVVPDLATLSPVYQAGISTFQTETLTPVEPPAKETAESSLSLTGLVPQPLFAYPVNKHSEFTAKAPGQYSVVCDIAISTLTPNQPLAFSTSHQELNAAPAEFMIGIDRAGRVLFLLAERKTGSDELDKELLQYLRQVTFPADAGRSEVAWDRARVSWRLEKVEGQ